MRLVGSAPLAGPVRLASWSCTFTVVVVVVVLTLTHHCNAVRGHSTGSNNSI